MLGEKKQNKSYWLALWGWSARGIFNVWVVKYIRETNINISEVSGTSMWSIIGAAYALWISEDKIVEEFESLKYVKLIDPTLKGGLIKWNKVYDMLKKFFGDANFSDTKIPLKVVAADIQTGKIIVFDEWKIIDAIRSSISIPGVFSPYIHNGMYLVDGGVLCNLPIEVLDNEDIIAVSVIKTAWSLWKLKKSIIWYNMDVALRVFYMIQWTNETQKLEYNKKNITLIKFTNPKYNYSDFKKAREIANKGYSVASRLL